MFLLATPGNIASTVVCYLNILSIFLNAMQIYVFVCVCAYFVFLFCFVFLSFSAMSSPVHFCVCGANLA